MRKKGLGTNYQSIFRLLNMFRNFLSIVIHHLVNFDTLIQRGFWVIPETKIGNLCKWFHEIIVISFSIPYINLKTLGKQEKNYKNFIISRIENQGSVLGQVTNIFQNFLRTFFWCNIKNSGHKFCSLFWNYNL